MTADLLRRFYDYDGWATARLLDAADGLPAELWTAPGGAGVRSIRDGFVHMLTGHLRWLSWWEGSLPVEQAIRLTLDPEQFADAAAVRTKDAEIRSRLDRFVGGLTDADAQRTLSATLPWGGTMSGPLWETMLHVANHGTQHRAEIAALLSA